MSMDVLKDNNNLIPLTAHVILTPDNSPGNNNQVCDY